MKSGRMHGRVEGAAERCAMPGCRQPGEFRAPLTAADFDGPGTWRWLCLDHVRAHNARYNYFDGMSAQEISDAQSPYGGWDRATRVFATGGADPAPAWSDFSDPLDAIATRFRNRAGRFGSNSSDTLSSRFSGRERHALSVLGLGDGADLRSLRKRYSELVRRYHPDRNGGDRSHEKRLGDVIAAYQLLKGSPAFQ